LLTTVQVAGLLMGVLHTRNNAAVALGVLAAPVFLVWRFGINILSLGGGGTKVWKRTARRLR
jgi:hypothetical protein